MERAVAHPKSANDGRFPLCHPERGCEAHLRGHPRENSAAVSGIVQRYDRPDRADCWLSTTGYWNPVGHLTFLFKSSQTLNALPDFQGVRLMPFPCIMQLMLTILQELSWCPVNDVVATIPELLINQEPAYPNLLYREFYSPILA